MDITGFERSDKNKSGIISVFDFFCVGKAQTSIPMIVAAIQTLKSICIASCKQFFPPKFVKLDGERSLIEAAKTFGPSTRRLVEKWHARRNIEKDLTDALNGDMKLLTVIMTLYESLESAKSKWDADLTVKHMEQRIKEMRHPNENKILKTFKIYFNDPSLIAHYTWKDVPLSHHGPGLQEGLFGRYKHDYRDDILSNKKIDDVLFKHFNYRKLMTHRFVEDFQNGKRAKGMKEAQERYKNVQGQVNVLPRPNLGLDDEGEQVSGNDENILVRKSPRKATPKKRKENPNESLATNTSRRRLTFSQDADYNEPFETSKGRVDPGFCQFSKAKQVRNLQWRILRKAYSSDIAAEKEKLEEKKNQRRQSTTVRIEARTEEFETVDAEDNLDFELIKNQLNEDAESIPIGEILFSEANTVLETNLWQSLNSTKLETDDLESVACNRYYEVTRDNAVFGYAASLFNAIKPKDDRTRVTNVALKYVHSRIDKAIYIFINMQTSKPVRRFKNTPFIIQFIASLKSNDTSPNEGIFHLMPSQKSIKDDVAVRRRIKIEKDITGSTETLKSIKDIYPFVVEPESEDIQREASRFDNGIDIYSYVLIRYKISFGDCTYIFN